MNYFSIFDIFGVEFKQQISLNVKAQKSIVGGVVSLLILGTSLAYLSYVLNDWVQFRLLPKSTNTMKVNDKSTLVYDEDQSLFEFFYWKYSDQQTDPFNKTNNILTPLGVYYTDGVPSEIFSFLDHVDSISSYGTKKFGLNQTILKQNAKINETVNSTRELMIVFVQCNQSYLSAGQSCSSQEEFENFFESAVNYIAFQINLNQFNQITQKFELVKKSYYFCIDQSIATQGQILFKQTNAFIDNGILLGSIQEESFVQDAQIITLASSITFWKKIIGSDSYFNMILRLDPVSYDLHIVYPKLGEVLAQVGSIANILMLVKFLVFYYNEKLLEDNFTKQILSFYFSNYMDLQKSKTSKNKKACQNLIEQAQRKLVYINIIYELSRIQLFLQNQFGRNKLKESHQLGIILPTGQMKCNIEEDDKEEFRVEDFFLLSQPNDLKLNMKCTNNELENQQVQLK